MSNTYHLATSKNITAKLQLTSIGGIQVVFNEILSEGPLENKFASDEFWKKRYDFFESEFGKNKLTYFDENIKELIKIEELSTEDQVIVWLENTIVSQLNFLAICTFLLENYRKDVFYSFIAIKNLNSFENEFQKVLASIEKLTRSNLVLAKNCWESVVENNFQKFENQNISKYSKFRNLNTVLQSYFKDARNSVGFIEIVNQIVNSKTNSETEILDKLENWDLEIGKFGYSREIYQWYIKRIKNEAN